MMGYNKRVSAGSAAVIKGDVPCANGTIHVVNSVLLPPDFVTPPIRPEKTEFPDSLVLDVLKNRIEPRQALGIDPLPAAEESSALTL